MGNVARMGTWGDAYRSDRTPSAYARGNDACMESRHKKGGNHSADDHLGRRRGFHCVPQMASERQGKIRASVATTADGPTRQELGRTRNKGIVRPFEGTSQEDRGWLDGTRAENRLSRRHAGQYS